MRVQQDPDGRSCGGEVHDGALLLLLLSKLVAADALACLDVGAFLPCPILLQNLVAYALNVLMEYSIHLLTPPLTAFPRAPRRPTLHPSLYLQHNDRHARICSHWGRLPWLDRAIASLRSWQRD